MGERVRRATKVANTASSKFAFRKNYSKYSKVVMFVQLEREKIKYVKLLDVLMSPSPPKRRVGESKVIL